MTSSFASWPPATSCHSIWPEASTGWPSIMASQTPFTCTGGPICRMNINLLQIFGLYVICHYLKIKINGLNQTLLEMKRLKRFSGIRKILISMDKLYTEIDDYNENYWSKFLGVFWATYGLCLIMWIYFLIYLWIRRGSPRWLCFMARSSLV